MKLWILADALTGYTYNFEVYTGKSTKLSAFGLAYDVVMRLCKSIFNQGYHVFFDNFYSGVALLKDLLKNKTFACGTLIANRKGVPQIFKDVKAFSKAPRGSMRWQREGNLLYVQWLDNKAVTVMSTMHTIASTNNYVNLRSKVKGEFRALHVRQPKIV